MSDKEKAFAAAAGFFSGGEAASIIDSRVSDFDYEKVKTMTREELLAEYRGRIQPIVSGIYRTLPKNALEKEELFNVAFIALIEAQEQFDPAKKTQFVNFFPKRVRGAILDYLRSLDMLKRRDRQVLRFKNELEKIPAPDRQKSIEDFAAKLKISPKKLLQLMDEANEPLVLSQEKQDGRTMEFSEETGKTYNSHRNLQNEQARIILMEVLDEVISNNFMPKNRKRYKQAFLKHYYSGLTFKEIGQKLGLQESRVSQVLKEIKTKMKIILQEKKIHSTNTLFG